MSITSLLFPLAGSPLGLGATPEARGTVTARAETPGASAFSHWLRQAQPSAMPPKAATAPSATPVPADSQRPDTAAPRTEDPKPEAAEASGHEDKATAPDEEAREPATGELPGAWWLMLPEPPAPAHGLEDLEIAIAAEGATSEDPASPKAATKDVEDAAPTDAAEVPTELAPNEAVEGADLAGSLAPVVSSIAPGPLRGAEGPGATPLPWVSGLSPVPPGAGPSGASSAAATTQQTLATPVHDPDFPEALAQSITVMTRQGVQEAKLHLNPAEMGTVSVHIAVNGQQAQVDFAASASATRAALEASLSHLAAALHSAGLTLTGGGVSQDTLPRRPSQEASSAGSQSAHGEETTEATAMTRPLPRLPAGRLDLYA